MTEIFDCKALELACRERAIADPQHRWKWLGQAERWKDLGHNNISSRFQGNDVTVVHLGPADQRGLRCIAFHPTKH